METHESKNEIDVLVVGAGITGIYQLHRAREAGFTALLVESGSGPGGTWFWNRYPGARFDSESYTYGYLFSKELFDEWEWQEHFAGQPEIERYLNHVVDRFDLGRDMRFDARVTSAVFDERAERWTVALNDSAEYSARFVVAATGVLSVPFFPAVVGREDFRGESLHTGLWPIDGVDMAAKRVAIIGTGSSGVQLVPVIADDVASLTVYQRSPNWCTPLNNAAITAAEQSALRVNFESIRETLNTSIAGFLHEPNDKSAFDDTAEDRQAFYEVMWNSPGFTKLTSHYKDILFEPTANAEWCEFIATKIRELVDDEETADRLIPKDHRYGEKRPPFVNGYFEAFNNAHVSLVDLSATPITRITEAGIETGSGLEEFDIIVWATGFDFGTGALNRMGIRGREGRALEDHWADGPCTFLGVQTTGFPNLFFPGGPHAAAGNNPRYNGDQVDFITEVLIDARERGNSVIEVDPAAEDEWTGMVDRWARHGSFTEKSYYYGTNVPGKPRRYLLNSGGRPKLFSVIAEVIENEYRVFRPSPPE